MRQRIRLRVHGWIKVEAAVKAALDAGLYVIINIHWEGGWLNHPVDANKEALDERLEAMWKQIALRFRDYDDRLLFARNQ